MTAHRSLDDHQLKTVHGGSSTPPGYSNEYMLLRSLNFLHVMLAQQHTDQNARLIEREFAPNLTLLQETDMTSEYADQLVDWKIFQLGALEVAARLVETLRYEVSWSETGMEQWTADFVARLIFNPSWVDEE